MVFTAEQQITSLITAKQQLFDIINTNLPFVLLPRQV